MPIFIKTYPALSDSDIAMVERRIGTAIPDDLREHYLHANGGKPVPSAFLRQGEYFEVQQFLGMKYAPMRSSFEETYEDLVLGNARFPVKMIPFAVDDAGDYFLYSTSSLTRGQIFFNQSDYFNDPDRFVIFLSQNLVSFLNSLTRPHDL